MKKIIFFLSNLSGGGAQRTILNILRNIDSKKFRPKLVLLNNINDVYSKYLPDEIEVIDLRSRGRSSILKIGKLLKQDKPDFVFSTLPEVNIAVSLAHKLSRCNSTLILRETNHRDRKNLKSFKFFLMKWSYNYANKVVALSEGVLEEMSIMYQIPIENLKCIYNPIELPKKEIKLKSNGKGFNIIACGRLTPQKNFTLLIESLIEVNKYINDWKLTILGIGPEEDKLKEIVNFNNLQDKIIFIGFKDNPKYYMEKSDLFILSSQWEGFGHVIVEAMSVGTPVLSTDCPHGPNEILEGGKVGWLVENNNKTEMAESILKLMRNKEILIEMSKKSLQRAKDFEATKITKQYEELISKCF